MRFVFYKLNNYNYTKQSYPLDAGIFFDGMGWDVVFRQEAGEIVFTYQGDDQAKADLAALNYLGLKHFP